MPRGGKRHIAKGLGESKALGDDHTGGIQTHPANAKGTGMRGRTHHQESGAQVPLSSLDNHLP
jgi:hypothetical protein